MSCAEQGRLPHTRRGAQSVFRLYASNAAQRPAIGHNPALSHDELRTPCTIRALLGKQLSVAVDTSASNKATSAAPKSIPQMHTVSAGLEKAPDEVPHHARACHVFGIGDDHWLTFPK